MKEFKKISWHRVEAMEFSQHNQGHKITGNILTFTHILAGQKSVISIWYLKFGMIDIY